MINDTDCLEIPATLPFNHSELETLKEQSSVYTITCTGSNDGNTHLVRFFNQSISSGKLVVQPLAASTSYTCSIQHNHNIMISTSFTTCHGPLSLVVAGIIGGLIGVVISLVIIAGITGIVIGTMILVRRKRAITRSKNRPVLRTNSKIYKRDNDAETSPETVIENNLQPLSLPRANKPQPPHKQQQQQQRSQGPLVPPKLPCQSNVYTSQNLAPGPIDSEFEDDDDEFEEPEETYETMLSTADNVAYKHRPQLPKGHNKHKQKQLPEEYYDYLPT